jgi:hypothetical protein
MLSACLISKATDTNSECVILIARVLRERLSVLRCTYIVCPVLICTHTDDFKMTILPQCL